MTLNTKGHLLPVSANRALLTKALIANRLAEKKHFGYLMKRRRILIYNLWILISIFDVASTNNNLLSGGNIQYQVSCWWLVSPSHRQQTYMENILLRLFTTGAQPCLHLHSNQISHIQLVTNHQIYNLYEIFIYICFM